MPPESDSNADSSMPIPIPIPIPGGPTTAILGEMSWDYSSNRTRDLDCACRFSGIVGSLSTWLLLLDHRITGSPDPRIAGYPMQQDSNDPATPLSAVLGNMGNLLSPLLLCAHNAPQSDHNK
ncbi:uncharacterized protein Dyak_GE15725 [Drosophila yakuba]|uniref:Uncharacterized protein n=1 Tax=Drosophila yakuba TaxID=7245 RepID=A0A0R1EF52_DROYA|nr:uncharacterized protein Dyak_GE15725 [Drosophila yakuba]